LALRSVRGVWPTIAACPAARLGEWLAALELHRVCVLGGGVVHEAQAQADAAPEPSGAFERLRQWRADLAHKQGIPAYRIITNRALLALIESKPKSREEFLSVPGVGAKAWDQYGREMLTQLAAVGDR
jgi:superfamily II DNA helicase RecQ